MQVLPSLDEVLAWKGDATHMALSIELLTDMETPISLYQKLGGDRPNSFLLESAEGGDTLGRYSFIGCEVAASFRFSDGEGTLERRDLWKRIAFKDPLEVLQGLLDEYRVVPREGLPPFQGGAVFYLSYDCVRYFESIPLPAPKALNIPEGIFLLVDELVIFDHLKHRVFLVTHIPLTGDRAAHYQRGVARLASLLDRFQVPIPPSRPFLAGRTPSALPFKPNLEREAFERAVSQAKEAIAAGEVFQVVLSQRFTLEADLRPLDLYRALRALNPSPYLFYLRFDGWAAVGASPEVLVKVQAGEVLLRPIAGTRKRGATPAEDDALQQELLSDEKELAEHRMLLDLGRNDVGRIARIGTVQVERPLHIERYSHVMHIVTDVRGRLDPRHSALDALRACFPAGTVSGAPKIRAMELISSLEPDRRGLYAGAVGYVDFSGNLDTCIAIRTMVVEPGRVHLQAGAGIVFDSDPAKEYEECLNKARGGMTALALALERSAALREG